MKLTKTAIDAMKFEGATPKSRDLRWDDELPGFGVRVWPSGKKTFFVTYRHLGRERFMAIGAYGVLTLQQARDMARLAKVQVLQGKSPLDERRKRNTVTTFGDMVEAYNTRHAAKKKSGAKDIQRLEQHVLPKWRNLPLASLRRADLAKLHHELGTVQGKATLANRILAMLSKMFNLAKSWGYLPENFANPARGIDRFEEVKRDRFVTPDELPRLIAAIEKDPNIFVQAAIWLYLLTGLRKSELLRIKWEDVDYTRREIRVHQTKTKPIFIPLTTHMEKVLAGVPHLSDNPYVFCSPHHGKHLVDIKSNWEEIRKQAGLMDVRIHDLRHTVASWMISSGASLALVGRVLNHARTSTTERYAHFMTAPVVTALEDHGKALYAALKPKGETHDSSPDDSVDSEPVSVDASAD